MIAHASRRPAARSNKTSAKRQVESRARVRRLEDDVVRRIRILLSNKEIAGASHLVITHSAGVVTLSGEVADQHQHWRCLECCRHIPGVRRIVDDLAVVNESATLA